MCSTAAKMFTTSQSYLQIAAKSKLNTICQEANHQIWQLMAEEIQKIGPEMFLHAIYCYVSDPILRPINATI